MTHTPGPWEYGVRRDGSMWLSVGDPVKGRHYQGDVNVHEDDARLICAAPDMLAALERIADYSGDASAAAFMRTTAEAAILKAKAQP